MIAVRRIRELTIDTVRGASGGHFIAAGSGLVRTGQHLYVIADDQRELAVFPAEGSAPGRLARLLPGELPAEPGERKREKPDFEALALLPLAEGSKALLALGSGTRPSRRGGVLWRLDGHGALFGEPRRVDLEPLYQALEDEIPDLNVEGATVSGERLLLFQRGNGKAGVNAVIALDLDSSRRDLARGRLSARAMESVTRHDLGQLSDVRLCFSDATALRDGTVVFTAVAESGEDTYHDGACTGAAIGTMDADGVLIAIEALEQPAKIEGVEAEDRAGAVHLLLVADADDPGKPSPLLAAKLGSPPLPA